jgi:hypothetical protein
MTFEVDHYPSISDFSVRLVETDEGGKQLEFASVSRGRLAWFPAWEHVDRDLRHFIATDVPLGTFDEPFLEEDEAWRIVIFEHDGWIYVAEGDHPVSGGFTSRFRVPRDRYLKAWAALIDAHNPITPLDEDS